MDNLRYTIDVDDKPAQQGTERVNKAIDSVSDHARVTSVAASGAFASMSATMVASGRNVEQAFTSAGHAAAAFGGLVIKTSEAAISLVASYSLAAAAIAKYGASTVSANGVTDSLIASFRVLRLTASAVLPNVFGSFALASATVGLGILAEQTIKLVNARARLIEQQSLFAATQQIPVEAVERVDAVARAGGLKAGALRTLYTTLDDRIDKNQNDVRAGFATIGVPGYLGKPGEVIDPQLLTKIAEGFSSIEDPAKRAAAAVQIFGKDNAKQALDSLGLAFVDASHSVDLYGKELDTVSRNQIFRFRQDLLTIREWFTDFSAFRTWGQTVETIFESAAAKAEQFLKLTLRLSGELSTKILPEGQAGHQLFFGDYPQVEEYGPRGRGGLRKFHDLGFPEMTRDLLDRAATSRDALNAGAQRSADDLLAQIPAAEARRLGSDPRAALSAAEAERDSALQQLAADRVRADDDKNKLPPAQLQTYASQYFSAAQRATALKDQVDAADLTRRITDAQAELKKKADDLSHRVLLRPEDAANAFDGLTQRKEFDASGNLSGVRYFGSVKDQDGQIHQFQVANDTIRQLMADRAVYAISLNAKASKEAERRDEEAQQKRLSFEAQIFQKRLEYSIQTSELELRTIDRIYAHQNELAGYTRDEKLGVLAGQNPQTVAGKLLLEQQKLAIQQDYITSTSVNDADAIRRDRDRQISDVAEKRVTNQIGDQEYFARIKAIQNAAGQAGAELNDKYAHDLITAQQNAANASVAIVRDAQLREFESLKSSIEGVLQESEQRGSNVFKSIANAAKTALLGAFNEIISSQLAAALFRMLNPGATVTFDPNGQGRGGFSGLLGGLGMGTKPVFGGGISGSEPVTGALHRMAFVGRYSQGAQGPVTGNDESLTLSQRTSPGGTPEFVMSPHLFDGILQDTPGVEAETLKYSDIKRLASKTPVVQDLLHAMGKYVGPATVYRGTTTADDPVTQAHERFHAGQLQVTNGNTKPFTDEEFANIFGSDKSDFGWARKQYGDETYQAEVPAYMFEHAEGPVSYEQFGKYYDAMRAKFPDTAYHLLEHATPDFQREYAPSAGGPALPHALRRAAGGPHLIDRTGNNDIAGLLPDGLPIGIPVNRDLSAILGIPDASAVTGPAGASDVASQPKVYGHGRGRAGAGMLLDLAKSVGFGLGHGVLGASHGAGRAPVDNTGPLGDIGDGLPMSTAGMNHGVPSIAGTGGWRGTLGDFDMEELNGAFHPGNTASFGQNLNQLASSNLAFAAGGLLVANGLSQRPGYFSTAETTAGGALMGAKYGVPLAGAGAGLLAGGIRQGGVGGLVEDTAGGAMVGFQFGGPVGAAVGAAVGLGIGVLRATGIWSTFLEQVKQRVKDEYHLSINNDLAEQIAQVAKQQYGGSIAVALHSQQVMQLLGLYAETTGQGNQFGLVGPQAANLAYSQGNLYQSGTYHDGTLLGFQSGLKSLNPFAGTIQSPTYDKYGQQPSQIVVSLDGKSSAAFLQGQTVNAMSTPDGQQAVSDASLAASSASYNRLQTLATLQRPSTVIS